jgi:Flp pilus assembly pilin Flp
VVNATSEFPGSMDGSPRGCQDGSKTGPTLTELRRMAIMNVFKQFIQDEQGQDLIEYALLATFVSLLAIVGAGLLGTALNNWYGKVATNVNTAAGKVS